MTILLHAGALLFIFAATGCLIAMTVDALRQAVDSGLENAQRPEVSE